MKTLVLGASDKAFKYSYKAAEMLLAKGHEIELLGNKEGEVQNIQIKTDPAQIKDIDTVTVYLNQNNQKEYEDFILKLRPKRVIFNPGAENESFAVELSNKGIETMEACTLVLLSTGQY